MERRKAHERAAQEGVPIGSDLAGEPWHLETGSVARNRKLHMALTCLSPRQHQAIWLRLFEERESEDVAVIMGVKRATVRSNIRHGVKRLKELMEVPEDELSRYQRSG